MILTINPKSQIRLIRKVVEVLEGRGDRIPTHHLGWVATVNRRQSGRSIDEEARKINL
jgi:hypothetical protein